MNHSTEVADLQHRYKESPLTTVAYFSKEFMVGEALAIYSGGLGNMAGDQLEAANDLGALGIKPEVCHLNKGHAASAVLERARGLTEEISEPFGVALSDTRSGNLFTTHTAVAAGIVNSLRA